MSDEPKLTRRQQSMITELLAWTYLPIGLLELIDDDFIYLVDSGHVISYQGEGASQRCRLTNKGRVYAGVKGAEL